MIHGLFSSKILFNGLLKSKIVTQASPLEFLCCHQQLKTGFLKKWKEHQYIHKYHIKVI